jgi:hypothetical protein
MNNLHDHCSGKNMDLIKQFISSLILLFLFLFLFESVTAGGNQEKPGNNSREYVFISDTQELLKAEYLWNITNNNLEMTRLMFNDIIELNPCAVFHMGDLVAEGHFEPSWKEIDKFLERLSEKEIPFYPVMGNHELLIMPRKGEAKFQKKFPQHSRTGYLVLIDSVSVILLNSNFGNMSPEEITRQNNWYNNKLDELDRDPSVNLISVGTHYSPYTNSTRVPPSEEVQKYFVPGYLESLKARLFFSGHSHAFEHFVVEGKDFLVIGGGGGPQQPILVGDEARFEDHFNSEDEYRRFHYVRLIKEAEGYSLDVIMVDSTYTFLEHAYRLELKN